MRTLEEAFDHESALVFGAGGSGDVVGSIPTARLLENHGVDVTLGGVTWEPVPYDSVAGTRSLDEFSPIDRISDAVGLATGETTTDDGVVFTEVRVARHYDELVALVDPQAGATGLARGIDEACETLDFDLVVGVDAGGDVLAVGDEPGLRSPLIDGVVLAALDAMETTTCLGVFGYGSDGELSIAELEAAIARSARRDGLLGAWGLTPRIRRELASLLDVVETEASRLPVEAARGELGPRTIRRGDVTLELRAASTVTFYFDPATIAAVSNLVTHVLDSNSIRETAERLSDAGYTTEFEREQNRL